MPFVVRTRADDSDKHTADVTCLVHHKGRLYSGSDDGKIKMWEEDLKLVKTIIAHSRSIFSLVASGDTLYSCSNDGKVKAWSLNDLRQKGTLLSEETEMWKLCMADNALYAGDNEGNVKVLVDGRVESNLNVSEPVKDMIVVGNLIYTIRDFNLVISEIFQEDENSPNIKKTIMGRAPVCIAGDCICFTSRSGKDIIVHENSIDLDFKELAQAKNAHEMIINSICGVKSDGNILLYSGGWDRMLKQWKVSKYSIQKQNTCTLDMTINTIATGAKGEVFVGGSDGHIVRVDA